MLHQLLVGRRRKEPVRWKKRCSQAQPYNSHPYATNCKNGPIWKRFFSTSNCSSSASVTASYSGETSPGLDNLTTEKNEEQVT